jgi:hypothetical protein
MITVDLGSFVEIIHPIVKHLLRTRDLPADRFSRRDTSRSP